ncbi:MAG TPA: TA system VapC family ribonuclease toxin [Thermoanaerobaculia bacterium]|nr:TA system VapC family ribonuclease toxin [Thermoanaerobaculia bacterium]
MIFIDANLLLYAYDRSSPVHEPARLWLTEALTGPEPVGFSWPTVLAFFRIATNPKIFRDPFSIDEIVTIVEDWFAQPTTSLLHAGDRHWEILRGLLLEIGPKKKLIMDAHLAALALEHDATLLTRDRDFEQFPKLRFANPFT